MAPTVVQDLRISWHPLACSDTAMRPNTLLMMKLAFLLLLLTGYPFQIFAVMVPWEPSWRFVAQTDSLGPAVAAVFVLAGGCVLFNRLVRHASMLAGLVVCGVSVLSQTAIDAGSLLCGCILLLGGFQGRREHPSFVQWQIVVAHFALFLGATNGAAWAGALTADAWIPEDVRNAVVAAAARTLPAGLTAQGLAWMVLVIELLLTIGLAARPLRTPAVFASLAFHTVMYGMLGTREVAVMVAALGIGLLSFLRWPETTITVVWPRSCGWPAWLRMLFDRTDWDHRTDWPMPRDPDGELEVSFDDVNTGGWWGLCTLLLHHPAFHFGLFLVGGTMTYVIPLSLRGLINACGALGFILFFAVPAIRDHRSRRGPPTPLRRHFSSA